MARRRGVPELGQRLVLGQRPQPFRVEDAVDRGLGEAVQAVDLDRR